MKKIVLNNGLMKKLDKNELLKNEHTTFLASKRMKQFYDLSVQDLPYIRIETEDFPKLKYLELNVHNLRSTRHIGQRKLLLSELEFLTIMYEKYNLKKYERVYLLYIGAAPGYHIPLLTECFPNLYFHLYDPLKFSIKPQKHIIIYNEFFDDEYAKKYIYITKKYPLLFVSDIRDPYYDNKRTDQLENDMILQKEWATIIKPLGAMFKFRLLYEPGITQYFYGDSYLPVWGPLSTTETRLICNKDDTDNWTKTVCYDNTDHEQRLFYFNNCYRMNLFNHDVTNVPGICKCYDCYSEIYIISKYLKYKNNCTHISNSNISDVMNKITRIISISLKTPNIDVQTKNKKMMLRFEKSNALEKYKDYFSNNIMNRPVSKSQLSLTEKKK